MDDERPDGSGVPDAAEPTPFSADPHDDGTGGAAPTRYGYGPPSYGDEPGPVAAPSHEPEPSPLPARSGAPYRAPSPYGSPSPHPSPHPSLHPSPHGGPPPARTRTGVIVGLVAGGLVLVLLVVGGIVLVTRADDDGGPAATVRTYLQALAQGNAAKALAQGTKPADTAFVTQKALQAQRRVAKIASITVGKGDATERRARVGATYTFGDQRADATFSLTRIGGRWKLDDTVYPIDLTRLDDVPGLTLLGIDVGSTSKAYVFPGPLTWGSSNPYLAVAERDPGEFPRSPTDARFSSSTLETSLSAKGQKVVAAAVRDHVTTCAASRSLTPPDCPQAEYDYQAVDGTAAWTAPSDLGALEYRTGSPPTEVSVSGDLTWSVTYTATEGSAQKQVTASDVGGSVYGTVDLTQDPPVFRE